MSEELKKLNAFEAFKLTQQTYAEAEEKAKVEAGTPKVERFRIGEDGEYSIRILPLAPNFDEDGNVLPMDRKGYEYAVHQLFIAIDVPSKKGKNKKINIPVIRTTDKEVGYSVDLIDTYVKIAKEMYSDDEELIKMISGGSFGGGLRWNYQHAIMVLDTSSDKERAKGPQLWQCSHAQYKEIDAAKMRLWKELRADDGQETCPISGFTDAYPVKVIRSNSNNRVEYTIEIGRKTLDIKEEELERLLALPRIPEQIYRYTKYQMEATLAFLKQYDEKHDMEVCNEPDFKEAVDKLAGELPADDTSHFDLTGAANKEEDKGKVTIDSLWGEYDMIIDQDLGEKSDEYQELREKIRQFIEDKRLDVRISKTKNNLQLLNEIEEALDSEQSQAPVNEEKSDDNEESSDEAPEDNEQEAENESEEPEEEPEEQPRRRRSRPGSEAAEQEKKEKPEEKEEKNDAPAEESPRRRVHSRRLR